MEADAQMAVPRARPAYATPGGRLYVGDAAELLDLPAVRREQGRVQLVFTSPPFPLCREKRYGNLRGDEYTRWLAGFARQEGYAAFTVSASVRPAVKQYIAHQEEHHRVRNYREELVDMLRRAEIEFDPQYLD